jgi:hypothetical protein
MEKQMKCPKCKGRKFIGIFRHRKYGPIKKLCPKCLGHGELDWVSVMFGVKEDAIQISFRMPYTIYGVYAFRAPGIAGNTFIMKKNNRSPGPDSSINHSELILDFVGMNNGYFDFWTN